jgi:hypothetical protein
LYTIANFSGGYMRVNIQGCVLNSGAKGGYLFQLMECVKHMKELRERVIGGDATAALQEFFAMYYFSADKENAPVIMEKIANGIQQAKGCRPGKQSD